MLNGICDHWAGTRVVVSAEVGLLKPQAEIYPLLLAQHGISAAETVFLDDMPHNVEGAKRVGIAAIQFEFWPHTVQCDSRLREREVAWHSASVHLGPEPSLFGFALSSQWHRADKPSIRICL